MKKTSFLLSILLNFAATAQPLESVPQTEITNGIVHARIFLPDQNKGYYRGSRFDWSGVIPALTWKGHSYFGQWFDKYSPTIHDAIMGPVQEFTPIGYDEAKAGETFIKPGIGALTKEKESKYSFATFYPVANAGTWNVKKKSTQVEFNHKFSHQEYAYDYTKKVSLAKGQPKMVLSHSLKNTGRKTIETSVYNHNFFVIDSQATGPDFTVKFPFTLVAEPPQRPELGKIEGNQVIFLRHLVRRESLYFNPLLGFKSDAKDYDIRVENKKTGAAVRITSDRPLSKLVFWSAPRTLCPEPYIHIKIEPGETFTWNTFYEFYTCDIIN